MLEPAVPAGSTDRPRLRSAHNDMNDNQSQPGGDGQREISDLIGVELVAGVGIWVLVVLAAFFAVGVVAGIIAILIGVLVGGWMFARAISRADTPD